MTEWIKCSDRLPEDWEIVIFYANIKETERRDQMSEDGPIFVGKLQGGTSIGCVYGDGWTPFFIEDISHWMPLPEQPK